MGPDLMDNMRKQAQHFGTEVVNGYVHKVDFSRSPFKVWYGDTEVEAKSVILSTGSSAKLIGLESELKLMGHGVSTCATCDGFFFRGKKIAMVGGGDSAMEEATFLTKFATEVNLIHRRDTLRASKIMQDRAMANPKIKFIWNTMVEEVIGTPKNGRHRSEVTQSSDEAAVRTGRRRLVHRDRPQPQYGDLQGRDRP